MSISVRGLALCTIYDAIAISIMQSFALLGTQSNRPVEDGDYVATAIG